MFERVLFQFLKEIRGERTQLEMSSLLGHQYNLYFKYESGGKIFKISDLIHLCECLNINLKEILSKRLSINLQSLDMKILMDSLFETWLPKDNNYVAKKLGTSPNRIWRLKNHQTELSCIEFFSIIHLFADRLYFFISDFISQEKTREILNSEVYRDCSQGYIDLPEISVLSSSLYLYPYLNAHKNEKHQVLKELSGLGDRFELVFKYLKDNKHIVPVGDRWEVTSYKGEVKTDQMKVRESLLDYIFSELSESHDEYRSFKIAPVTENAHNEIEKLLQETYQKINKIIDSDDPNGRDKVLMLIQAIKTY